MRYTDIFFSYLKEGFLHVLPYGYDHVLFMISLLFLQASLRVILYQCLLFTLAHTITLLWMSAGGLLPPSAWVEPLIALSILYTALENLYHRKVTRWRFILIFLFGLVHGMGFAGAFLGLRMTGPLLLTALLSFNTGVELAQLAVILLLYGALVLPFRNKPGYLRYVVCPLSAGTAAIALYWTIERIFAA